METALLTVLSKVAWLQAFGLPGSFRREIHGMGVATRGQFLMAQRTTWLL